VQHAVAVLLLTFYNKLFFLLLLMTTVKGNMAVLLLPLICVLEKHVREHLVDVMVTAEGHWCARMEVVGSYTGL
jgi:hypothetical protein